MGRINCLCIVVSIISPNGGHTTCSGQNTGEVYLSSDAPHILLLACSMALHLHRVTAKRCLEGKVTLVNDGEA